jgi:uncharacterized membrane-anchored protein
MHIRNVPRIDAGYWAAIVAASMCGTNAGDLAAGPLGLGHVRGIIPIAAVFLAIVCAEKVVNWTTVAFYWLAIIVLRTMATNIADFATHDMKISYPVFVLGLVIFMILMLWADRLHGANNGSFAKDAMRVPTTDWLYWITMLTAGVLGTALGDWFAEDEALNLGFIWASVLGVPIFVAALWLGYRFGLTKPWYWTAIVVCRTWGTDLGDMLVVLFRKVTTRPTALWISTAITAALLVSVIVLWRHRQLREMKGSNIVDGLEGQG